jgi:hypothetical protein
LSFQALIAEQPVTVLVAEHLRDGRIAIGTRTQLANGEWDSGELHLLDAHVQMDFGAWLAPIIEAGWLETVRQRQVEPLRTAEELYGAGPGALSRLALETLAQVPPDLLRRAMLLLANSLGPQARERLIGRLNETADRSEETELRRRLADENEAFAYTISAAALFDALDRGLQTEDLE